MRELICTKEISPSFQEEWRMAGIELTAIPLIKALPLPFLLNPSDSPDIWVFTSQRAVEGLKVLLKKYFLHIHRNKTMVAIGHKTSDALGALGFRVALRANNALALAEEINDHYHAQSLLHFCGDKRRDELSERLSAYGFSVSEKIIYQTVLTPQKVIWGNAEAALFFSPSAVESYCKANAWPAGKIAYAIGPTTAAALQQAGISPVFAAAAPNSSSLLLAVKTPNDKSLEKR